MYRRVYCAIADKNAGVSTIYSLICISKYGDGNTLWNCKLLVQITFMHLSLLFCYKILICLAIMQGKLVVCSTCSIVL